MINRPWANKNWYTFSVAKRFDNNYNAFYMTTSNRTIDLINVQEWIIIPKKDTLKHELLRKNNIKHMPEVCTVILNDGRKVDLVSGNIPSTRRATSKKVLLDPVVSIDQITPFFDAMKKARLM